MSLCELVFFKISRIVFIGLLIIGNCTSNVDAQSTAKLHIGVLPIDISSLPLYAADRGFFKAEGLDVDISLMNNGPTIVAAVVSGALEFGATNIISLANARAKGIPLVGVAPVGAYTSKTSTTALLVPANSSVRTARDLNGKTIGVVSLLNIAYIGVRSWLDKNGADSKLVKFVEVTFSEMGPALAAGRIDAASVDQPALNAAQQMGAQVLGRPYDAVAPRFLEGALVTSTEFAKSHPDVVRKVHEAMAKAADWANKNPLESAKILERYSQASMLPGVSRVYFPTEFLKSEAQPLLDAAVKYGVLPNPPVLQDLLAQGVVAR